MAEVPLDEAGAAAVVVELELEEIGVGALGAGVARLALGDRGVAVDERRGVGRVPGAWIVPVGEPGGGDGVRAAEGLVVGVVGVARSRGEQGADRLLVV